MSQEQGQKYITMFNAWAASMDDDAYKQIVYRGSLNKQDIKKLSGISDQAIKKNPTITKTLSDLEDDLRERGVLPPLTKQGKVEKDTPKLFDTGKFQNIMDSNRLSELEAENQDLRAQVATLEAKVAKLEALAATNADTVSAINDLEVFRLCPSK